MRTDATSTRVREREIASGDGAQFCAIAAGHKSSLIARPQASQNYLPAGRTPKEFARV
jgi:hypothetical protein